METAMSVSWLAVLAAVVASFLFGFLWYGPLFGKRWAALMNYAPDTKPDRKLMIRGMLLMVIGTFLTSYTLVFVAQAWRPSLWGGGPAAPEYVYGFLAGLWVWVGFYVPMLLGAVAWEGRSWELFRLNAAYHFLNLQLISMIVAYVR